MVKKEQSGQRGYVYYEVSVYDDETKTPEWIEEKRAGYPELAWQQEYEVKFIEGGISYFRHYSELFKDPDFD